MVWLPQLALQGGPQEAGQLLKGPRPFQPWAYLGFPPLSLCLCVRPLPRSALVIAAHPPPQPHCSSWCLPTTLCLCLRRMSHAVCWRRWVWHSPSPWGRVEMWGSAERWGIGGPFPPAGTQLRLLCCLTFFCSELWAQDPQAFLLLPLPPVSPFLTEGFKELGGRNM